MTVTILKYNSGNVKSVLFALQRLGIDAIVSDDHEVITKSDKIIFPGVGHAGSAMENLKISGLDKLIPTLKQPLLGICAGMQLLCLHSEEGDTDCLGIFPMHVKRFTGKDLKIPHTGWNTIFDLKSPLFKGVAENDFVYFVHSFYVEKGIETVATTEYGTQFSAAIQKNNFYGVQFHTEKSADVGSSILSNFLNLT